MRTADAYARSHHGVLFVTVVINYLDRSNLSITAPAIARGARLRTAQMGYVLSAFGWTYAALQIPGGWLVDRVAPRVLYAVLPRHCGRSRRSASGFTSASPP